MKINDKLQEKDREREESTARTGRDVQGQMNLLGQKNNVKYAENTQLQQQ